MCEIPDLRDDPDRLLAQFDRLANGTYYSEPMPVVGAQLLELAEGVRHHFPQPGCYFADPLDALLAGIDGTFSNTDFGQPNLAVLANRYTPQEGLRTLLVMQCYIKASVSVSQSIGTEPPAAREYWIKAPLYERACDSVVEFEFQVPVGDPLKQFALACAELVTFYSLPNWKTVRQHAQVDQEVHLVRDFFQGNLELAD